MPPRPTRRLDALVIVMESSFSLKVSRSSVTRTVKVNVLAVVGVPEMVFSLLGSAADGHSSRYFYSVTESDRSVLRRLADDGNEEAADLLAELAAKRGDLEELRRLVDDGNENAADRLAELAAERGDLEQLRRLVDDGNENAADRLAELAAERGDLEQLQRLVDEGNESAESLLSELIRKIK
jgi:hypothetical protein